MRLCGKAQSLVEMCALVIVIVAALMAMQAYMKRGLQGRWKDSADQLGEQYDPEKMKGTTTYILKSNSSTTLEVNSSGTTRTDTDNSTETKKVRLNGSL